MANEKPSIGPIVVLGDSLAAGYGARDANHRPARYLQRKFGRAVQDISVSGSVTSQTLMASRALPAQPSLILVSTGGNDVIRDFFHAGSYPPEKSLLEMDQLFDRLVATGAVVVYLGLNPPVPNMDRLRKAGELARSKGIIVVDGVRGLWDDGSTMSDFIHPNDKGYAIILERISEALKNIEF